MALTKAQESLLVKEFESLRAKMDQVIAEYRALERYAVLGTAAVYSFGFTSSAQTYRNLIFLVPILLVIAGMVRALALRKYIHTIGGYIMEVEKEVYGSQGNLGYERFLSNRRPSSFENYAANFVWGVLLIFNVIVWLILSGAINFKGITLVG
jgi:hypothetical protein